MDMEVFALTNVHITLVLTIVQIPCWVNMQVNMHLVMIGLQLCMIYLPKMFVIIVYMVKQPCLHFRISTIPPPPPKKK